MISNNIRIIYDGFTPTETLKTLIEDKMYELYADAPYGASLKASFNRRRGAFKGYVSVNSKSGRVFAITSANMLHQLIFKIFSQVKRQLEKRRSLRAKQQWGRYECVSA